MSEVQGSPPPTIPEEIDRLKERLAELETRVTESIASEVAKTAGPAAADAVRAEIEPYVEKIRGLVDRLGTAADRHEQGVDAWAHAKIDAVANAVKRAINVDIPLPSKPGEIVTGGVTVPGAETADQLAKG